MKGSILNTQSSPEIYTHRPLEQLRSTEVIVTALWQDEGGRCRNHVDNTQDNRHIQDRDARVYDVARNERPHPGRSHEPRGCRRTDARF